MIKRFWVFYIRVLNTKPDIISYLGITYFSPRIFKIEENIIESHDMMAMWQENKMVYRTEKCK